MHFYKHKAVIYSLLLHSIAFIMLYFGAPSFRSDMPKERVIAVEVLKISDVTNIPNRAKAKKQPQHKESKSPDDNLKQESTSKSEEQKSDAKKENSPDALKKPEDRKEKKVENKPKGNTDSKNKSNNKNSKKSKKKPDIFSDPSFMKTLEESAKRHKQSDDLREVLEDLESESDKPYNPDLEISISEKDFIVSTIQSQIHKSWYNNGLDTKGLKVVLRITFDIEGNVLRVDPEYQRNNLPLYHSFVENAIRATKMASPIKNLPADKFSAWENVELEFDPSDSIS